MDSISKRKNELTRLKFGINALHDEESKNLMAATTFPRVFSHYEMYVLESLEYIIEAIYLVNPKISDLKLSIKLLLLSLSNYEVKNEKILDDIKKISSSSKVEIFKKARVLSNIKNGKPHEILDKYLEGLKLNYHPDYETLIRLINPIRAKYRSRCNIAHGVVDLSDIKESDWNFLKDKVADFLDTIKIIVEDYITDEKYLR